MVLVDESHQLLKSVLGLKALLLCLSALISFILVDLLLVLMASLALIELNLDGDQIRLHALDHMLVRPLDHHLVLVRVLDLIKLALGAFKAISLSHHTIFNTSLFVLGLLKVSLFDFKLALFS